MARRKWRAVDVWAAAITAALFVGAATTLIIMSAKYFAEEGVTYSVDFAATMEDQSWTTALDAELAATLESDLDAGVPCEPPAAPTFLGVIVRGRDIHDRVRDYRVFPDRYYIEYRDGTVRCVDDSAPWGPVSAEVRENLNPILQEVLVEEGILEPVAPGSSVAP